MARATARPAPPFAIRRPASLLAIARIDAWTGLTLAMTAAATASFIAISILRWRNLETNAYDLAFFDQIIWNTSQGRWFETAFIPYNFTGQHFEPILLPFALAYRLFGVGPLFLTTTQATVAALAALPLFAAARRFGLPGPAAAAIAAVYLLNPYLHRAVEFDFHPEVMVALPAFAAAWAIAARRFWLAGALSLSTLLFKEDAVFLALGLAGLLFLQGARRPALITAAMAIAWAAVVVLVVMPLARDGAPSDLVDRYGYLVSADRQSELVPRLFTHPWTIPRHLADPSRLWTIALFVLASAPLAMFRPWLLVPLVPGLALAVLSTHSSQAHLDFHYAAQLVPLALVATVFAARAVQGHVPAPSRGRAVAAIVLAPTLVAFLALSPFSPAEGSLPSNSGAHVHAIRGAVALIPPRDSVSAQSHVLPRLSQREYAFEFPNQHEQVDWVVVDRNGHRSSQSVDTGFDAALEDVRAKFDLVYDKDGVEVFRRRQ